MLNTTTYSATFANGRTLAVDDYNLTITDEDGVLFDFGRVEYAAPGALESLMASLANNSADESDWQNALDADNEANAEDDEKQPVVSRSSERATLEAFASDEEFGWA